MKQTAKGSPISNIEIFTVLRIQIHKTPSRDQEYNTSYTLCWRYLDNMWYYKDLMQNSSLPTSITYMEVPILLYIKRGGELQQIF